jgi:hypothetical protein
MSNRKEVHFNYLFSVTLVKLFWTCLDKINYTKLLYLFSIIYRTVVAENLYLYITKLKIIITLWCHI